MSKKVSVNDEIIDIDFDSDEEEITEIEMVEDAPLDVDDLISKAMARQTASINKAISGLKTRVDDHEDRLIAIERKQDEILKSINIAPSDVKPEIVVETEDDRNIFDKTLGAVGGILHGVVDTAAFVLESTVDLVTLGRAKREY